MVFNTELITRTVQAKIGEIPELGASRVLLQNPDTKARFPVCVLQPPLQTPQNHGGSWILSFTMEVWGGTAYEAMRVFDLVKAKLLDLNFTMTGNLPLQRDMVTKKSRFGGYFEVRWNAVQNTFDKSR